VMDVVQLATAISFWIASQLMVHLHKIQKIIEETSRRLFLTSEEGIQIRYLTGIIVCSCSEAENKEHQELSSVKRKYYKDTFISRRALAFIL